MCNCSQRSLTALESADMSGVMPHEGMEHVREGLGYFRQADTAARAYHNQALHTTGPSAQRTHLP